MSVPSTDTCSRRLSGWIEHYTYQITEWVGSARAFAVALLIVILWAVTGPVFHFSDTWQLVINTSTTIVTFLIVFLLQRSQNKESLAVQLKLNEIVAALQGASNRLINIECLSEEEVRALHDRYQLLAQRVQADPCHLTASHSIEDDTPATVPEHGAPSA
jgi:low affinity Fe/Cu permease